MQTNWVKQNEKQNTQKTDMYTTMTKQTCIPQCQNRHVYHNAKTDMYTTMPKQTCIPQCQNSFKERLSI
jgi:hypothetical protein